MPGYFYRPRSSYFYEIFMHNLVQKCAEMARISATATAPLFFKLAPPRRAPPFLVRDSGAVLLKVVYVPSTDHMSKNNVKLLNFS